MITPIKVFVEIKVSTYLNLSIIHQSMKAYFILISWTDLGFKEKKIKRKRKRDGNN
jgi:uncharacterized protein with GYD domain